MWSHKIKPSDYQEDDRSCDWSFYSLVQIFPKALHSDKQGDWDYMTGFVQTSKEETRPRSSSSLIVSQDSFSLWTRAHFQTDGSLPTVADVFTYFWITVLSPLRIVKWFLWHLRFSWLLLLGFIRRIIYTCLNVCHFDITSFAVSEKVGILQPV